GDRRRSLHGPDAVVHELVVVELHSVRRLVLDAVPQRLELGAVEDGLMGAYGPTLIRISDLKPPGQLLQDVSDLSDLCMERLRQRESSVLQGLSQGVLHLARTADVP